MSNDNSTPKNYSDRLPRKVRRKARKCQHLTSNGGKCTCYATWEASVHFDNELYFDSPSTWAAIYFCDEHCPEDKEGIRHA